MIPLLKRCSQAFQSMLSANIEQKLFGSIRAIPEARKDYRLAKEASDMLYVRYDFMRIFVSLTLGRIFCTYSSPFGHLVHQRSIRDEDTSRRIDGYSSSDAGVENTEKMYKEGGREESEREESEHEESEHEESERKQSKHKNKSAKGRARKAMKVRNKKKEEV